MKKSEVFLLFAALVAVLLATAFFLGGFFAPNAHALPCSNEQPYPDTGWDVCTGYGQTCPHWICAYPPGTPGRWDVNGRYEPKVG